jgi:flagellar basal body-associated protein FliL
MRKLIKVGITSFFVASIILVLLGSRTGAQITILGLPQNLVDTIKTVINAILYLVGFIAVIFLIIGGVQYMTAQGNPDSLEAAKKTILYAIIGIVIIVISWAIVFYVTTQFGVTPTPR